MCIVYMHMCVQVPWEPEEDVGSSGAEVTCTCKLLAMGDGNQTQAHGKSSKLSSHLSHFPKPCLIVVVIIIIDKNFHQEFTDLTRLMSMEPQESSCSHFLHAGITGVFTAAGFFVVVEAQTQVLLFAQQPLCRGSNLPDSSQWWENGGAERSVNLTWNTRLFVERD